jgi:ankyrin repeat protein
VTKHGHVVLRVCRSDVRGRVGKGLTALHVAGRSGSVSCIDRLLQRVRPLPTPALSALTLCDKGANPATKDWEQGRIPVHYAAVGGHMGAVALLMRCAFETAMNPSDRHGQSVLALASSAGHTSVCTPLCCVTFASHCRVGRWWI